MSSFRFPATATAAATAVAATAVPVQAAEFAPCDRAAFTAAQPQGQQMLLDVHPFWWPVCGSQARTIRRVTTSDAFAKLVVFRITYDSHEDVRRSFNVQKQATLIAFHGTSKTERIPYMTEQMKIADLIASTDR